MKPILTWWSAKTAREQALLAVAGALAALALIWMGAVGPLTAFRDDARRNYESAALLLNDIQAGAVAAAELRGGAASRPAPAAGALRAEASARAQALGLVISRMQPGEDGALTLWLEDADPENLYLWLSQIERELGAPVETISIRRNEGRATLRVNVQIRGSAA